MKLSLLKLEAKRNEPETRGWRPRGEPLCRESNPEHFYSNFLNQINFIITKFLIVGDLPIEVFGWRRSTRVLGIGKESGKGGESSKSHFFSFTKISSFRLFSVVVGFRSGVVRPSSIFFLESDKKKLTEGTAVCRTQNLLSTFDSRREARVKKLDHFVYDK